MIPEIEEILKALTDGVNSSEEKISIEVKKPHIRFKREDLIRMIKLSAKIINLKSTQVVPKSITLIFNEDGYKMIANNDLEYLECRFDVLNETDRLYDTISLPIDLIKSIVNVMDEEIIIYKDTDGNYFIRLLLEGDLYLELPTPEPSLLRKPINGMDPINFKQDLGDPSNLVSPKHMEEALKALIPIVEEEVVLDRKRISFTPTRAYFTSNRFFMQYNLPLPSMKVSLRFADVVRRIAQAYNNSGVMKFYRDKTIYHRIIVECGDVLFTTMVTDIDQGNVPLMQYLDRVKTYKHIKVKTKDLERVVNIAYSLSYSNKEVRIDYNGELVLSIPMKNKTTKFKIPSKEITKTDVKGGVVLSAKNLKKLIGSFSSYDEVIMSILDNCIILNSGNLVGVLRM